MWRLHLLLLPVYAVMGFVWGALHLMVLIPLYLLTGRTPAWVRRDMRRLREKQLRYQERLGAGLPHRLEALGHVAHETFGRGRGQALKREFVDACPIGDENRPRAPASSG